jgi:hypothetical protein
VPNVTDVVEGVLTPYVGSTVADTCVRATALQLGKTSDALGPEDLPALEENVRKLLGPIAPAKKVDALIAEIRGGVS